MQTIAANWAKEAAGISQKLLAGRWFMKMRYPGRKAL